MRRFVWKKGGIEIALFSTFPLAPLDLHFVEYATETLLFSSKS
jgi:hypothetical protein